MLHTPEIDLRFFKNETPKGKNPVFPSDLFELLCIYFSQGHLFCYFMSIMVLFHCS